MAIPQDTELSGKGTHFRMPLSTEQLLLLQQFFNAEGRNYYNFALMHHKGHEVAPKDAQLSWNYMKQFRREKDGTVKVSLEN